MEGNELEIVQHPRMRYLEAFLVEMHSRVLHGHDDLEIGLLLEGEVQLVLEDRPSLLKEGDVYLINRYQLHAFADTGKRNLILAFQIPSSLLRTIQSRMGTVRFLENIPSAPAIREKTGERLRECSQIYFSEDPYKEIACASVILSLLHTLLTETEVRQFSDAEFQDFKSQTERINHVTDYLEHHYMEKISLQNLADQENMSVYYLSHMIRNLTGYSFREYLNHYRFEHALRMIRSETDYSLLDIALESGFSSTRYLNQAFKEQTGMDAKTFRRQESTGVSKSRLSVSGRIPSGNVQHRYSYEECVLYLQR